MQILQYISNICIHIDTPVIKTTHTRMHTYLPADRLNDPRYPHHTVLPSLLHHAHQICAHVMFLHESLAVAFPDACTSTEVIPPPVSGLSIQHKTDTNIGSP